MNKKILGLDLGTNSIGWALINQDIENKTGEIIKLGTRIIPMGEDILGKFDSGITESSAAKRTELRGIRRLRERHLLRRERLHRVLNLLNFLPEHYKSEIDFEKRFGQFKKEKEPKIAYQLNEETRRFEFIYKKAFLEMLEDFKEKQPEILSEGKLIPYDWTIYYLRKKALTHKIEKEELAWVLLNFNQKRGYYQLRGEDEEENNTDKVVEFYPLQVIDVIDTKEVNAKKQTLYKIILENGWEFIKPSSTPVLWKGKIKEFVVTTTVDKTGKEKRSFRAPEKNDWTLVKKRTEHSIENSGKTVGEYIYNALLKNPKQKIKGSLVRVVERKYYKSELIKILSTQQAFHEELKSKSLYNKALNELYQYNEDHKKSIANKDFVHLLTNDIIFYQRPLKSKKSLISDCKFETRNYTIDGITQKKALKCIPKSHPLFQEFRLWQWLQNLRIYEISTDLDVTYEILKLEEDWINLFDWLNDRKEIDHKALLNHLLKPLKLKPTNYRWNYVYDAIKDESKSYPFNETRAIMLNKISKIDALDKSFLTREREEELWHIFYSINDKDEITKALKSFASKHNLPDSFVNEFKKLPPYQNEYGAYSAKAIKKLLPLMRMGKYWTASSIHPRTLDRIEKIINGEFDENIKERVRVKALHLNKIEDFRGLPLWLTSYIVYDIHSEEGEIKHWRTIQNLENYLVEFKQHSLRNPIVEQVVTETLRVVRDIWQHFGEGKENFFDEIHIELGREMKNPSDKRKAITEQATSNENTNLRIKALLAEMLNDNNIENVRPYSPSQQEILKIYEDGALNASTDIPDDILKISKTAQPSKNDLVKYKLWLEQKYRSPYTGEIIPLNKLFTPAYEIEHIIPQSRFFDDSFSNKVICESEVNKLKGNQLGMEFISNHKGERVTINFGKTVEILSKEAYEDLVRKQYAKSRSKLKKLLLEDIPEEFAQRQMNDSRYISKLVKNLLSNIVRKEDKDDGTTSINLLSSNGQITSILKQDWGLNDVWNEIIAPRFERLNQLYGTRDFGDINPSTNKFLPTVPLEYSKGFSKKRIDHRHHALDALVIACVTRNHINYLNNQNALDKTKTKEQKQQAREDLRSILCYKKFNDGSEKNYKWLFNKPWKRFTEQAKDQLSTTVISFKQNLRVINKTVNKYERWETEGGIMKKIITTQTKGDSWAIRKPMHQAFVFGKVKLPRVKKSNEKSIVAIRRHINPTIDINKITDTSIQEILNRFLISKNNDPEIAFSADGLDELNSNILEFNKGKWHQPIYKARFFEVASRFQLGETGNKKKKYVQTADGTNLFYAIYWDEEKQKRVFETIPLNEVIEHQKWRASLSKSDQAKTHTIPIKSERGKFLFYLSPFDLVYIPSEEERDNIKQIDFTNLTEEKIKRIFVVNDFSSTCYFTPIHIAKKIIPKEVDLNLDKSKNKLTGSFDTKTASFEGKQIKDLCIKLIVNRIGSIKPFWG